MKNMVSFSGLSRKINIWIAIGIVSLFSIVMFFRENSSLLNSRTRENGLMCLPLSSDYDPRFPLVEALNVFANLIRSADMKERESKYKSCKFFDSKLYQSSFCESKSDVSNKCETAIEVNKYLNFSNMPYSTSANGSETFVPTLNFDDFLIKRYNEKVYSWFSDENSRLIKGNIFLVKKMFAKWNELRIEENQAKNSKDLILPLLNADTLVMNVSFNGLMKQCKRSEKVSDLDTLFLDLTGLNPSLRYPNRADYFNSNFCISLLESAYIDIFGAAKDGVDHRKMGKFKRVFLLKRPNDNFMDESVSVIELTSNGLKESSVSLEVLLNDYKTVFFNYVDIPIGFNKFRWTSDLEYSSIVCCGGKKRHIVESRINYVASR